MAEQTEGNQAGRDLTEGKIENADNAAIGSHIQQTHVHVYPTPGEGSKPEPPRGRARALMPDVEVEFRTMLAKHSVTLAELEGAVKAGQIEVKANTQILSDYLELLRTQIKEMRDQLNKLAGMAFLPPPSREVNPWVPAVTMASLLVIAVGIIILVVILASGGRA